MDKAEKQDIVRDLDEYRAKLRQVKTLLVELEAMITLDTLNRTKK